MVIEEALRQATTALAAAENESPRLDAEVLLAALLQKERLFLLLHRKDALPPDTERVFWEQIDRRCSGEPVAYIIGRREFMSLSFAVRPGVLIPRPDTETLVEFVLEQCPKDRQAALLDICTGSGAIAVSLAHYLPRARVTAWDISPVCLQTATHNAAANGVADRVTVCVRDALLPFNETACFDVIVSNPPYIPDAVIQMLAPDVRDHEPHLALAGGKDGLVFYRHLVREAPKLLNPGGLLAFEVGHDQAETVTAMLGQTGSFAAVGTRCDLAGVRRVVYGIYKKY